ncbi:hypothetical protein DFH08DRAFT_967462 [Mycena albidolilacea]|uniref:SEP domain-containing protein n=1 Tax=Mycena albidolilacea TaxID=1033008 RepID=A0AAD6ZLF5_9AGAR|nr:hypothetical protein DFH08DRAFT_967462 [Mycena albidolilacea]
MIGIVLFAAVFVVGEKLAIRRLSFWRDGFTVGDGPLMRSDDPAPSTSSTSAAPPAPASNVSISPRLEVDTTQPTKSIQVRLANGTRHRRGKSGHLKRAAEVAPRVGEALVPRLTALITVSDQAPILSSPALHATLGWVSLMLWAAGAYQDQIP